MHTKSLGCLSPTAIIAALITLSVIIGLEFNSGNSLFSAGRLNAQAGETHGGVTSHAAIGKDCGRCHAAFWEATGMAERCTNCHTAIASELQDTTTMHGALYRERKPACRDCHPEHRGADAPLTNLQMDNFPHETVGYALRAHQHLRDGKAFACADCHGTDLSRFDPATCASCHQQMDLAFATAHSLAYGANCLACHDGLDSYGKTFDHNRLVFKLEGKHAGLICTQCHLNARTSADFSAASGECAACHRSADPHGGRFGAECGACHTPLGWKPAKFDHNLANFKLLGKHAQVACAKCHANEVYQGTPNTCFACHAKDDQHDGKFGQQCDTCHTPNNWDEATFDHNLAAFKLEGQHAEVECEKCHANGVFKGTPSACFACHAKDDEHKGKFGQECSACHTPADWDEATFDHSRAVFRLTGAHSSVACEKCHLNNVFKGTPSDCGGCHGDPAFHAGLFRSQACSQCHNTNAWTPAAYKGPHPGIADEHGSGVNHGGKGCRSCHTVNLSTATCLQCHKSNNPGEGGGGGND
jgi:hypothetical protein